MNTDTLVDSGALARSAHIGFWLLAVAAVWNLNGVVLMALGWDRAFSSLMGGCAFLVLFFYLPRLAYIPLRVFAIPVCLTIYVVVSLVALDDATPETSELVRTYAGAVLLIVATSLVSYHYRLSGKAFGLVRTIAVVYFVASCSIVLSPWLDPLYRSVDFVMDQRRYTGFFGNPNEAGVAAILCLVFGLSLTFGDVRRRFAWVTVSAISLVAIIMTFSRGAMLTGILVFAVVLVAVRGVTRYLWIGSLAILFVVLPLSLAHIVDVFEPAQAARLSSVLSAIAGNELGDSSSSLRRTIMVKSWDMFLDRPFTGNGMGALHDIRELSLGAHNTFLVAAGEGGVISLIAIVAIPASLALRGMHGTNPAERVLFYGAAAALVMACMFSHNVLDNRAVNVMLGLLAGLSACPEEHPSRVSLL